MVTLFRFTQHSVHDKAPLEQGIRSGTTQGISQYFPRMNLVVPEIQVQPILNKLGGSRYPRHVKILRMRIKLTQNITNFKNVIYTLQISKQVI